MAYHSIPVPPTDFTGTLIEWNALTPVLQYRVKKATANKKWSEQNKQKITADSKKWRQNNKDKSAASHKKWRQNNKDKLAASLKRWKQQNPVIHKGHQKKAYIKRERAFYAMFGSQGII